MRTSIGTGMTTVFDRLQLPNPMPRLVDDVSSDALALSRFAFFVLLRFLVVGDRDFPFFVRRWVNIIVISESIDT